MKKRLSSILASVLALLVASSTVACTPKIENVYDDTKSQITVYSYNGGVGNVWLDKAIERFEEDYANYSFEAGKLGVEVVPNKVKEGADLNTIGQMEDVIFSEWIDVSSLFSMGKTLDISDIMDVPLNQYLVDENGAPLTDDTQTIEDKLYDETKSFFSFREGKYYGLPHYSHFSTIIYNKALFEDKGLYFANTPTANASPSNMVGYFISGANTVKSCGPDGVLGNADDGLPATYDEFFILCNYMVQKSVTPFIWTGSGKEGYTKYFLNSVYLNLAGKQKAGYNWSYSTAGETIDIVTGFKGETPTYGKATVTPDAFGALNKQKEKYQALMVYDKIIDTKSYQHDDCTNSVADNLRAQEDYIKSYNEGKPVAFLCEGSYWYNEANDAYYLDDARGTWSNFDELNDYQVLPLPRVYEGTSKDVLGKEIGKNVVGDQSDSLACINATIKDDPVKIKIAKTFLAYLYTQESLAEFTKYSNTVKMMKYTVNTDDLLNDYAKNLWNYCQESDYIIPYSAHTNYLNGKGYWTLHIQGEFWEYGAGRPWANLYGSTKKVSTYFSNFMVR